MGDSEIISAEVPNIQSLFKQGRKQEAWAIIEDIAMQGVPFPRLDEIKKEFFSDSKKWKWGQWGPDDDLVGRATVSVENSFLKNAEMLMGTKGLQMGRHLAAMAAKVQGALYSAAMDENTRPLCQALDDLQCDYPSPEFFKYSPPQHCFCNCIWIYIDKEEEGYEADKDWDKLVIDKTGSSPGELIDKHGHANSWYEQNDRKDVKDILVSYRVLEKAGKNLGQGLKEKAQAEKGLDGSSEEGKPPTETEGTGGSKPAEPPLGGSGPGKPPIQAEGSGGGEKPPEPPKTSQLPAGDEGGEGGKLSKTPEGKGMGFQVSNEEIKQTAQKLNLLKEKHPGLIENVTEESLKKVADYLADINYGPPEPETWEIIMEGHVYSYACFLHEKTEISLLIDNNPRSTCHGEALCRQYELLSKFIEDKTGKEYDVILLCCADSWKKDPATGISKDYKNAEKLETYLKDETGYREKLKKDLKIKSQTVYNKEKHTFNSWSNVTFGLREIMNSIRLKGTMP